MNAKFTVEVIGVHSDKFKAFPATSQGDDYLTLRVQGDPSQLDAETLPRTWNITVRATDIAEPHGVTDLAVTILLIDINDHPSYFSVRNCIENVTKFPAEFMFGSRCEYRSLGCVCVANHRCRREPMRTGKSFSSESHRNSLQRGRRFAVGHESCQWQNTGRRSRCSK